LMIVAFLLMTAASLPLGGPHSEVTAKCPFERTFSSLLSVFISMAKTIEDWILPPGVCSHQARRLTGNFMAVHHSELVP